MRRARREGGGGVSVPNLLSIRPFAPTDRDACLAVFRSNLPHHFAPSELPEFEAFLADREGDYWVVELAGALVACGGCHAEGGLGRLTWGMVHEDCHRASIGSALLGRRVEHLFRQPEVVSIAIETSQKAEGFFARHGFVVTHRVADGFGEGLDRVDMRLQRHHWRAA